MKELFTPARVREVCAMVRAAHHGTADGKMQFEATIPRDLKGAQISLVHAICLIDSLVDAQSGLEGVDREVIIRKLEGIIGETP